MSGGNGCGAAGRVVVRAAILLILITCVAGTERIAAGSEPEDSGEAKARSFCRLFFAEDHAALQERMTERMRQALTPALAARVRASLLESNGALESLGEAWAEDEIQGYRRYRVPARFERGTVDLRVVFDGSGLVAGFFQVPHAERETEAEERPRRPQEPVPPYPYFADEVTCARGDLTFACTVTTPPGTGPFPGAVLLSGSGAQNRDEELLGHKPFLVLADRLTRAGVVTLRCDDRGVGGSSGLLAEATTDDLARDALAALRYLRERDETAGRPIGLIGHSEGGMVAPLAASLSEEVGFVVMLAGPGVPGDRLLVRQLELMLRAEGTDATRIDQALAEQKKLIRLLLEGGKREALAGPMRRLTRIQLGDAAAEVDPATLDEMVARGIEEVTSRWFLHFLAYDPRPALRSVQAPVLALIGERDLQVDPRQNLPEIREALRVGGNPDFTVRELPGLNHLFQPAETGGLREYAQIEETFAPAALEEIVSWVVERAGK